MPVSPRTLRIIGLRRKSADPTRSDRSSWRLSPSTKEDFPRRPQRLSIPDRYDAYSGNLPAVHPREPPETPTLPQSNSAPKTSHVCTGGTVLQEQNRRNRKSILTCAQTVEDGSSLWKPQENRKTIRGGTHTPKLLTLRIPLQRLALFEKRSRIVSRFPFCLPTAPPPDRVFDGEKQPQQDQHNRNQ